MARPKKATVDYFPHDTTHGSTMQVLEAKWGNDGYAFWFKLLEMLGGHDGHYIDCRKPAEWEFLAAKTRVDDETSAAILDMLAKLNAIDPFLWKKHRVIFCPKFLGRIEDAYRKRKDSLPTPEKVYSTLNITFEEFPAEETPLNGINDGFNRERERERERERKEESLLSSPLTEEPPIAVDVPKTATKMTMIDFSFLHNQMFGFPMPRGCNNLATDLCQRFTVEQIRSAFEKTAEQNPAKHTMAYLKTVLLGPVKPKLAVVAPQTGEAYNYPSPEREAIIRRHLEMRDKEAAEEEARYAARP